jgi:hypothetical protein
MNLATPGERMGDAEQDRAVPDRTEIDRAFSLWAKYEDIAMHFNELMMRWRLQAIGGLATLVTIAGFVVGDTADLTVRYRAMFVLASTLAAVWVGVASIDLFYYRTLLRGAVAALLKLEEKHPNIKLSTEIEEWAKGGAKVGPYVFYLSAMLPLVAIIAWSWCMLASASHLVSEAEASKVARECVPSIAIAVGVMMLVLSILLGAYEHCCTRRAKHREERSRLAASTQQAE